MSSLPHRSEWAWRSRPDRPGRSTHETDLVSDHPRRAAVHRRNLVNPWGMSSSATSPIWVSDNGAGRLTLYNGAGVKTGPGRDHPAATGAPWTGQTGVQSEPSQQTSMVRTSSSRPRMARSPPGPAARRHVVTVNMPRRRSTRALHIVTSASGARSTPRTFTRARSTCSTAASGDDLPGGFVDPNLPAGFAPFGIQNVGGNLIVSYAKQDVRGRGMTMSRVPATALSTCTIRMAPASSGWCRTVRSTRPGALPWRRQLRPVQRRSPDRELRRWDDQCVRSGYRGVPGDPYRCCRQSDRDRGTMGPAVRQWRQRRRDERTVLYGRHPWAGCDRGSWPVRLPDGAGTVLLGGVAAARLRAARLATPAALTLPAASWPGRCPAMMLAVSTPSAVFRFSSTSPGSPGCSAISDPARAAPAGHAS